MSYFVVERNSNDATLRIPVPEAFDTREAAIAALSAATASGEVTLGGDVYIADLGAATPVLVMQPVAPVPVAQPTDVETEVEAPAPLLESAEEPGLLDEASADVAYTSWEPVAEASDDGSALADALKRAASSLEDEGIVAPASIAADDDLADVDAPVTAVAEPAGISDTEPVDRGEWPWANVDAYVVAEETSLEEETLEVEPVISDDVPLAVSTEAETPTIAEMVGEFDLDVEAALADLEEPSAEAGTIITSAPPEGEDAYLPHPVILGDYGDSPEAAEVGELETPALEVPVLTEDPAPVEAPVASPFAEVGYEPTGELDLDEYTCQDCVYSNTCPKVGQTAPADCGSFQWRSE